MTGALRQSDGRQLTSLATPIALTQRAQVAVSTTNIALMGTLGVREVAAGGLALVLFNQIRTMCVGLITGTGNQVATVVSRAEKQGRRAEDQVREVVRSSFLIATLAGLLGGALLIGLGWALRWLGQDAAVLAQARPMMVALARVWCRACGSRCCGSTRSGCSGRRRCCW
ncbi:hypothetical protein GCM10010198_13650 [Nocardia seriolae]